ncbi:MAG TPA: mechanosensitive ion channel [Elainellaceae cyanobacterium]
MNDIWHGQPLAAVAAPINIPPLIAQATNGASNSVQIAGLEFGPYIPLIRAIAILVIGWIIATLAAVVVRSLLNRTDIDNRLASWIVGDEEGATPPPIEKWVANTVFWTIIIFVLVAFFQAVNLEAVSEPLNSLLEQVFSYLPRVGGAAVLLAIAWALATIVKLITTRGLKALKVDERISQQSGTDVPEGGNGNQFSLSETIGNVLYWFIFLFFLPSILSTLQLEGPLEPVQNLLDQFLAFLPRVVAAVIIFAVGWLIATIVKGIVKNLLAATGIDRFGLRLGIGDEAGEQTLSGIIGLVVFALILIPVAISALDALNIESVSEPAIAMLNQVLNTLPEIFTAGLILVLAYYAGKFLGELATTILTSIGFDNIFYWLGLQSAPAEAPAPAPQPSETPPPPTSRELKPYVRPTDENEAAELAGGIGERTPSEVVGIIVLVGIMLFAAVAAINILNIEALTSLVTGIVIISGRILAGLIVFAIGLYLANLAFNVIASSGGRQSQILGQTARIAIITLISAMALQQIGVATNIVNLAFGLLLGAIAVAIALAFGLGGRDIASEQIREWLNSFKAQD